MCICFITLKKNVLEMDFETKVVGNVKFFEWNMCGCMQNI